MNNKGFTLVELLAVIVIIALLMVLTVPNIIKLNKNTKLKAYQTKVELIEKQAIQYGLDNISSILRGTAPISKDANQRICTIINDPTNNAVTSFSNVQRAFAANYVFPENNYACAEVSVKALIDAGYLSYDSENLCNNMDCTESDKNFYNNIVTDPRDNFIMNECLVYIYYKYKRVYAYFDRNTCDTVANTPVNYNGHKYNQKGK